MKRLLTTTLFVITFSILAIAQTPSLINYQAVVRGSDGAVVDNATIGIRFTIREGGTNGTAVFVEEQTILTNEFGLATTQIGNESPLDVVDWANGEYFLQVEVDPTGGTAYQQLMDENPKLVSVPYALHAKTVEQEGQTLTLSQDTLFISDGNFVLLQNFTDTDDQTLSVDTNPTNDVISIEDGNSIVIKDDTKDADSDPANELQVLSINGDTIFISNGNFVVLPNSGSDNDWTINGQDIHNANAGNVGIGINTPAEKLHIHKNNDVYMKMTTTTATSGLELGINTADEAFLYNMENTKLALGTNGTERLEITAGGNIGINDGFSSPTNRVEIFHNSNGTTTQLNLHETENDWARMSFTNTNTNDEFKITARPEVNASSANWNVHYTGTGNILTVQGDGHVGIGQSIPVEKLHILNGTIRIDDGTDPYTFPTSDGNSSEVLTTDGSGNVSWQLVSANLPNEITDADLDTKIQVEENNDEDFIRFDTQGNERMLIDPSGNVGIKSPSPAFPLDIRPNGGTRAVYVELNNPNHNTLPKIGVTGLVLGGAGADDNIGGAFNAIDGTGGDNIGLKALGSNSIGDNYGILTHAQNGSNTNYGIHAKATGGGTNWSGYFEEGNAFIHDNLLIANNTSLSPTSRLKVANNPDNGSNDGQEFHSEITVEGFDPQIKFSDYSSGFDDWWIQMQDENLYFRKSNNNPDGPNTTWDADSVFTLFNDGRVRVGNDPTPQQQFSVERTTFTGGIGVKTQMINTNAIFSAIDMNDFGSLVFTGTGAKTLNNLSGGFDGKIIYIINEAGTLNLVHDNNTGGEPLYCPFQSNYLITGRGSVTAIFQGGGWYVVGP